MINTIHMEKKHLFHHILDSKSRHPMLLNFYVGITIVIIFRQKWGLKKVLYSCGFLNKSPIKHKNSIIPIAKINVETISQYYKIFTNKEV